MLGRNTEFIVAYLTEAWHRASEGVIGSRGAVRLLLTMYLLNFDPNNPACHHLARVLVGVRKALSPVWQDRIEQGQLLDVDNGPRHAGAQLIEARDLDRERMRLGLHGAYSSFGFGRAAVTAAGRLLSEEFVRTRTKPRNWDRFVTLVSPGGAVDKAHQEAAFRTFLEPFVASEPPDLRDQLKPILLSSFGDPRTSPATWPMLSGSDGLARREGYLAIVRRWLVSDTIDLFFKIIDRHGLDHHWSSRRAFWRQYFDSELVVDACVALASRPHSTARRIAARSETASLSWPPLRGPGDADHAVLLMQIGEVVVAEWSHNGKVRIWRKGDRHRPALHKLAGYYRDELKKEATFEAAHLPPDGWQVKVERELRRLVGVGADGRR